MYFRIKVAGLVFGVTTEYDDTYRLCRNYLTEEEPLAEVRIDGEDVAKERARSAETDFQEGRDPIPYSDGYLETLAVYRKIASLAAEWDTVLFHGSALAMDGKAYVFTARSGTGKSTHAALWRRVFGERVIMVNDDKPWIRLNGAGEAFVYGTPWSGKHKLNTNAAFPIAGICVLERGTKNEIPPVDGLETFPTLLAQTFRPENSGVYGKVVGTVSKIAGRIPCYRLRCNMDPEAAEVSYRGMCRDVRD